MTSSDPHVNPQRSHQPESAASQQPARAPGGSGVPATPVGPATAGASAGSGGSGRGITVWHVLTAALAIICLVLVILLTVGGAGGQVGASARTSAAAACDLIEQVPEDGVEADSDDGYEVLYLLSGAQILAELAAEQDASYTEFREAMRAPRAVQSATFSTDSEEFIEALSQARAAC